MAKRRTWARKAELVAIWDSVSTRERKRLTESEGVRYKSFGTLISKWRKDPRVKIANGAPRRLCKICDQLKALDQFELTQYSRACIQCSRKGIESKIKRLPTRYQIPEQDDLIAKYRAIRTSDPEREAKRQALADAHDCQKTTLAQAVMRWEKARRTEEKREISREDVFAVWLVSMFGDLEIDQDTQNKILAHRFRYERGL